MKERALKVISADLIAISARLASDVGAAKDGRLPIKVIGRIESILSTVDRTVAAITPAGVMSNGLLAAILKKATILRNVGGFATVANARYIAREIYKIDRETFDAFLSGFMLDHPEMVEFGRGISGDLTQDDALELRTAMSVVPEYIYYIKLKAPKECDT